MDFNTIISELDQGKAVQYAGVAGITVLLYDLILTMGQEIDLIWSARPSIAKYLYFCNRYSVAALMLIHAYVMTGYHASFNNQFCGRYVPAVLIFDCLEGAGVIAALILLRVYVLYKNMKGITIVLALLWLCYTIPPLVIALVSIADYFNSPSTVNYNSILGMCTMIGRTSYMFVEWVSMVLAESIVCAMITYKTVQRTSITTPVMATFFRDGLLYYVVMLVGEGLNLVAFVVLSDTLYFFWSIPSWCLASLLISRLYLNLRGVYSPRDWDEATTFHPSSALENNAAAEQHRSGRRHGDRHAELSDMADDDDEIGMSPISKREDELA